MGTVYKAFDTETGETVAVKEHHEEDVIGYDVIGDKLYAFTSDRLCAAAQTLLPEGRRT